MQVEEDLTELVHDRVLSYLQIEIIDLQDIMSDCIPDGYPRYQIYRHRRIFGAISKWGDKYCTRLGVDNKSGWDTLYEAVTAWVLPERLIEIEAWFAASIRLERSLMPDYM